MKNNLRVWLYVLVLAVILPWVSLKILPTAKKFEDQPNEQFEQLCITLVYPDNTACDVPLESYVIGVVAGEMPSEFDPEALKAQAVIARTYALKHRQEGGKHKNGTVCTESACCQAYRAPEDYIKIAGDSAMEKIQQAVNDTAGQVLVYGNELIEATYFSCSGGTTEAAAAVWGTDVPYLQATESQGEENTAHYVTTVKFSIDEFAQRLGLNTENIEIGTPNYTEGGGVATMIIGDTSYTGVQLRQLLGLKSTAIRMQRLGNQVIVTTQGFGHRVGLSQYGAEAMAVSGSKYTEILEHYYKGTNLQIYKS